MFRLEMSPSRQNSVMEEVVDQTKVASLPSDNADLDLDLEEDDVPFSQLLAKYDPKIVKRLARSHGLGVLREERQLLWKMAKDRGRDNNEDEANKTLFAETVKTCFGNKDPEVNALPSLADSSHANSYCLTQAGQISVVRILTVFAYNSPEVQYCPLLYPVVATFRHYLSGNFMYYYFMS